MGLTGWIFYFIVGVVLFFLIRIIELKFSVTKLERLIFTLILWIIVVGSCFSFSIPYTSDIFLIFVFLLIDDVIYTSYFLDKDFFDRSEENLFYYIILIVIGFFLNQEFINQVTKVFLTGEDLRLITWFLIFLFLYQFMKNRNIFSTITKKEDNFMSTESVLVRYTKLKYQYQDVCNYSNFDLTNIMYAIMIFESNRRSKILRNYDYFMFKLNGSKRKLGIMQVESSKFITDIESIDIVYKKLDKLFSTTNRKKKLSAKEVINKYCGENAEYVQYIFDIIKKF